MKRLLASITVLSLLLAACSHNENNENDKKDNNSKTEHKDKKSDSNSKDKSKNHQKSQEQNDKIQNLTIMETIIKHHPVIKRIMVTIHKQERIIVITKIM